MAALPVRRVSEVDDRRLNAPKGATLDEHFAEAFHVVRADDQVDHDAADGRPAGHRRRQVLQPKQRFAPHAEGRHPSPQLGGIKFILRRVDFQGLEQGEPTWRLLTGIGQLARGERVADELLVQENDQSIDAALVQGAGAELEQLQRSPHAHRIARSGQRAQFRNGGLDEFGVIAPNPQRG